MELDGPAGRRWKVVPPLVDADLAAVEDLIPAARTWTGLVQRLPPNPSAPWRIGIRAIEQIGRLIRDRLFGWDGASAWLVQMEARARAQGRLLRFVLDLDESAPGLCDIPLDLAFDGTAFLFKNRRCPAVRCDPSLEWGSRVRLTPGNRLLVVTAHEDQRSPTRDELRTHAQAVREAAARAGLRIDWIEDATPKALEQALTARGAPPVHALYVACHGREDHDHRGRLALRGGDVTGIQLAEWLADHALRVRPVKTSILCACSSASPGADPGNIGMAHWLLRRGQVLVTMGYRAPVQVVWALSFTERMFEALADGVSLEEAFAEARARQPNEESQWPLPLLFARRSEGGPTSVRFDAAAYMDVAQVPITSRLPPRPPRPYFTARDEELRQLETWLRAPGRAVITAVAGEGGIGKTELATCLAHRAAKANLPVLWLERPDRDLRVAAVVLLEAVAPAFRASPEMSTDELLARAREQLGQSRGLLVLDDVASGRDASALVPGGGWNVLLTTRSSGLLAGVAEIALEPLDTRDAVRLLSRVAWGEETPPEGEAESARALVERLGRLPLAIEVAGGTLRGEGLSATAYLEHLKGRVGSAATDLAHVEAVSTRSLEALGDEARRTLQALAVLPSPGARLEMVATALGELEPAVARRLDRLVRRHLASFAPETGRYRLHPLMREAMRTEARADEARWDRLLRGVAAAMRRVAAGLNHNVMGSVERVLERWRAERDLFEAIELEEWADGEHDADALAWAVASVDQFRQVDWTVGARRQVLDTAERMATRGGGQVRALVLGRRGELRRRQDDLAGAAQDYQCALELSEAIEDRSGQANVLHARGYLRYRQDDLAGAAQDYQRALELFEAIEDRLGQANVLRARGNMRCRQDDLLGAAQDYQRALDLFEAVEDRSGQANVLRARGELRRFKDDLAGAAQDYQRALELFEAVEDRSGQADVLHARGYLRHRQDDLAGAAQDYQRALELFEAIEDRLGQANVLRARGDLRCIQDDLAGAVRDYQRALELFEAVEYRLGQANVLRARGDLRCRQDDLAGAAQDYQRALELFEAIEDRLGQASVLHARGDLRRRQDDLAGAAQDYQRALELFEAVESRLGQANVLHSRGDLRRFQADLAGAAQDYQRALELFEAVESRLGQANVLHSRGDLRRFQADLAGAAQDYQRALELFEAVEYRPGQAKVLHSRGDLRRFHADLAGAAQDYQRALELFEAVEDRLGQANVLHARGDLRRFQADLASAARDYQRALELFEAVEDRLGQANVLRARGYLRYVQADLASAAQDYQRALELFEAVEHRLGQANVLHARGDLRRFQADLAGAAQDYQRALELFEAVEERIGQANVVKARGDMAREQGDMEAALPLYVHALRLYELLGDAVGLSNVLAEIARVHALADRPKEARAAAEQALPFAERAQNNYALELASAVLAHLSNQHG
ncbi:tetratricopeptide repeat protein [Sorangium sp. So ce1182]|uniref:tetratricopeptide repeat protein n=1 Tax=Sorangium sp. So ce1182 TaxID=3133334 RepID=UPI003F600C85